jgi:hypothetical protein
MKILASFEGGVMLIPTLLASTVLAAILIFALVREIRLRRALQELLRRVLQHWRSPKDV